MTPEGSGEERLRAELAAARVQLGAACRLLDQVVRSIPAEYAVVDRHCRTVHVSEALAAPLGVAPEGLVGKGVGELFPDHGQALQRLARQALETGEPLRSAAARGPGPRGARRPPAGRGDIELMPLHDEGGDVTHLALMAGGAAIDTTDPLLKNVALRVIMNVVPALIAYVDREERYRICNEMFRAWHGAAPEAFLGRTVREVLGDEAYAVAAPHVKAALSGRQVTFESWIPDPLGGRRWVESTLTPHTDAGGQVLGFVALVQDVSERNQVASQREELLARLAASEARFRRIHESGVIGVIFWAKDGSITDANDAFLEMMGYSRDDLAAGRLRWREMTPPEYALLDERAFAEIAQRGFCTPFEKEYLHKDGRRVPILIAGATWDGSAEDGVAWILDITRRKREEERRELLIEVGRMLSSSANLDETLVRVTRLVVWSVATFAAIELLDGDGRGGEHVTLALRDPTLEREALDAWRGAAPRDAHPAAVVARTGKRQMLQAGAPASAGAGAPPRAEDSGGAHDGLLEALGVQSLVVVPLLSRGRVLGVLSYGSSERRYDAEDLRLAEELGGRAGTALDNARLADERERVVQLLDTVIEQAPIGMALFDQSFRYTRVNKALAEMNGVSPEAHVGRSLREIIPSVDPRMVETLARTLRTGEPASFEVELETLAAPGVVRSFVASCYPICLRGEVIAAGAMCYDITERKRVELQTELLAKVGAALSSLTDPGPMLSRVAELVVSGLADACVIYTSDGAADDLHLSAVAHVDAAKAALLRDAPGFHAWAREAKLGPAEVVRTGQSVFLRELPAGDPGLASADAGPLRAIAESGMTSWILVPIVIQSRPYGAIGLGLTAAGRRFDERDRAVAEELGRRVGIALDNASLFSAAQRERTRAEEAARAKDEFLAVVSHELRTPLNAMLGWTRMLRSGQLSEATARRALEVVERNAILQSQLIEDILDVSRIVTGNMRIEAVPVDLPQVVHAAVDTLKPAAVAKGVQISLELAPGGLQCTGDPARLQQVVWNLVSNAVKFTDKGGRVEVRMVRTDAHLELTVEDTGRGVPPEFLPHMFERFRQADAGTTRTYGGLGLGLAIVKHLVELHGGAIRAHSAGLGKGATFVVSLPAAPRRPSSPAPERAASAVVVPPGAIEQVAELRGLRVLVVDDEEDARDLLASVLSLAGVQVMTASSVEEALRVVRDAAPEVVVSDIGMPGEDGYALVQRLRSLPPERGGRTPAIALTAYARIEERTKALLAGFNMHVPKPVEPSELLVVVANVSGRLSPSRGAPGGASGPGFRRER